MSSKTKIYIIGRSLIQNELLARHLETAIGYPVVVFRKTDQLSVDEIKIQKTLILLDFRDGNWDTISPVLKKRFNMPGVDCFVALFNVNPIKEIGEEITKYGIRGVFYEHYSCETLIKGVKAILKDDLWLSRKLVKNIFFQHQFEISRAHK